MNMLEIFLHVPFVSLLIKHQESAYMGIFGFVTSTGSSTLASEGSLEVTLLGDMDPIDDDKVVILVA